MKPGVGVSIKISDDFRCAVFDELKFVMFSGGKNLFNWKFPTWIKNPKCSDPGNSLFTLFIRISTKYPNDIPFSEWYFKEDWGCWSYHHSLNRVVAIIDANKCQFNNLDNYYFDNWMHYMEEGGFKRLGRLNSRYVNISLKYHIKSFPVNKIPEWLNQSCYSTIHRYDINSNHVSPKVISSFSSNYTEGLGFVDLSFLYKNTYLKFCREMGLEPNV